MKKHIELTDDKITYASKELRTTLCFFYFGFKSEQIMIGLNKNFKRDLIKFVTELLSNLDLSWDDIPDDVNDWGEVEVKIRELEQSEIVWNKINWEVK